MYTTDTIIRNVKHDFLVHYSYVLCYQGHSNYVELSLLSHDCVIFCCIFNDILGINVIESLDQ